MVTDLRILAVRLDPPEVLIDPVTLDSEAVFIRILLAKPGSASEVFAVRARICAKAADDGRCPPQTVWVASQRGEAGAVPAMVVVPTPEMITEARAADPLKGYGGTRIPLELEVRAPDGTIASASKLIIASDRKPGYVPNGALDVTAAVVRRAAGAEQRYEPGIAVPIDVAETVGIFPELAPGAAEEYDAVDLAGQHVRLRERISYSFYATPHVHFGDLYRPEPGADLADEPAPGEPRPEQGLVLLSGLAPTTGELYVVARDGRGAEAWLKLGLTVTERRICNLDTRCPSFETSCK